MDIASQPNQIQSSLRPTRKIVIHLNPNPQSENGLDAHIFHPDCPDQDEVIYIQGGPELELTQQLRMIMDTDQKDLDSLHTRVQEFNKIPITPLFWDLLEQKKEFLIGKYVLEEFDEHDENCENDVLGRAEQLETEIINSENVSVTPPDTNLDRFTEESVPLPDTNDDRSPEENVPIPLPDTNDDRSPEENFTVPLPDTNDDRSSEENGDCEPILSNENLLKPISMDSEVPTTFNINDENLALFRIPDQTRTLYHLTPSPTPSPEPKDSCSTSMTFLKPILKRFNNTYSQIQDGTLIQKIKKRVGFAEKPEFRLYYPNPEETLIMHGHPQIPQQSRNLENISSLRLDYFPAEQTIEPQAHPNTSRYSSSDSFIAVGNSLPMSRTIRSRKEKQLEALDSNAGHPLFPNHTDLIFEEVT